MSIAFFDMDRTLLSRNSGVMWVKREFFAGRISPRDMAEACYWLFQYHLGRADIEEPLRRSVMTMKGDVEAELRARTHQFYDDEVRSLIRPGGREAVEYHRGRKEQVVLLTTSSDYMSEKISADLELDAFLCNRFEVDEDGRYTGGVVEPLCYGAGKIAHAKRYADEHGVALEDCAFYTDSASDAPLMEVVGRPIAVHPDPKLKKLALVRGWPIVRWGA